MATAASTDPRKNAAPRRCPVAGADGIVNATPVGMAKYPGLPLPATLLRPTLWVAEIVYFPMETELLRTARALGCRTLDGGAWRCSRRSRRSAC